MSALHAVPEGSRASPSSPPPALSDAGHPGVPGFGLSKLRPHSHVAFSRVTPVMWD